MVLTANRESIISRKVFALKYISIKVEKIDIQIRCTTVKPLLSKWLVEYFNEITSQTGSSIIVNCLKEAGIYDSLEAVVSGLPSIDPLEVISALANTYDSTTNFFTIDGLTDVLRENFVNDINDQESSEWEESDDEDNADFKRNANDIVIGDE